MIYCKQKEMRNDVFFGCFSFFFYIIDLLLFSSSFLFRRLSMWTAMCMCLRVTVFFLCIVYCIWTKSTAKWWIWFYPIKQDWKNHWRIERSRKMNLHSFQHCFSFSFLFLFLNFYFGWIWCLRSFIVTVSAYTKFTLSFGTIYRLCIVRSQRGKNER